MAQSPGSPEKAQAEHAAFVALNAQRQTEGMFSSPVAAKDSFTNESGIDITDSDIDRFIDPDVTGADRALAKRLMASMPQERRGDFLYMDGKGKVLSNRDAIRNAYLADLPRTSKIAVARESNALSPQVYPPVVGGNQGGAYLREYSQQGVTAGFGFVTIPCSDEYFIGSDAGDTYFGENGEGSGQTEGGLQTQQNSSFPNGLSISLYARSTALVTASNQGGYGNVTYPTHYGCGTPIELTYGQTQGTNSGMFYTSASLPQYSPLTYSIPGGTVLSTSVSYFFGPLSNDFNDIGVDPFGYPTPCKQCWMRRNTTIAQNIVNPNSNECFGFCHNLLTVRWDQIFMGQLISYNNTPSLISLTFGVTATGWYGGIQYYPDNVRVQHNNANLPTPINFDFEGIYLSPSASGQAQAAGTFAQLIPIPTPGPTPTPIPKGTPNPCLKNPRLCEAPIRTPTPVPSPSKKP